MPFNESITQFTTETSNHADNFNEVHNKLLENDKFLKTDLSNQISILSDNKADKTYVDTQDTNLSNQISILSTNMSERQIRTYTSLSAIGLTDVQFAGLTQIQAFDLLTEYMGNNSYLTILLTSGVPNFRQAIMQGKLDTKNVMKFEFEVGGSRLFHAYAVNGIGVFLECSGGVSISSGWKQLATTDKIDILQPMLNNGWSIEQPLNIEKIGNKVFLKGWITSGTMTANTTIMNIPVGYRPSYPQYPVIFTNNGGDAAKTAIGTVVNMNGDIRIMDASKMLINCNAYWEV